MLITALTDTVMTTDTEHGPDPRLWQLLSPALPIGGYSYSQSLEYVTHAGWVHDATSAQDWISELAEHLLVAVDLPILLRVVDAMQAQDAAAVTRWNQELLAQREAAELFREDANMGRALRRLLCDLEEDHPAASLPVNCTLAVAFAAAGFAHFSFGRQRAIALAKG